MERSASLLFKAETEIIAVKLLPEYPELGRLCLRLSVTADVFHPLSQV